MWSVQKDQNENQPFPVDQTIQVNHDGFQNYLFIFAIAAHEYPLPLIALGVGTLQAIPEIFRYARKAASRTADRFSNTRYLAPNGPLMCVPARFL